MRNTKIKKSMTIITVIITGIALAIICLLAYVIRLSPEAVQLNPDRLVNIKSGFFVFGSDDKLLDEAIPIKAVSKASLDKLPDYVKYAFVAVEDKRFYEHDGVDSFRIFGAIKNNIFSGRLKEGASTITQQLIKNTHLSGHKNISRKINEIRLARQLETLFTKDEILEMYINTIYFGNNAYGIENAASVYFNTTSENLTVAQAALLAGLIKAPTSYAPNNDLNKCTNRRNLVLRLMKEQNYISDNDYKKASLENVDITLINKNKNYYKRYMHGAIQETCELLQITEKQLSESRIKIYTYCDREIQKKLEDTVFGADVKTINGNPTQLCGVVADNQKHGISAFCGISRYNLYTLRRNIGSTAKPLAVYAPALEERIISPATPIKDEKISFDGYSPGNYGGKYYGWITIRKAVAESLNSAAVKTLNALTAEKARKYLIKNGIRLSDSDNNLAMALGSFSNGIDFISLTGGYMTLANKGEYSTLNFVRKITDEKGRSIYEHKPKNKRVFGDDTAFLMTDMLISVVNEGTAKKLRSPFQVAAKTGTTGMSNSKNNSDALVVSYTTKHTVTMWCGGYSDDPLPQKTIGGGYPTQLSKSLYENIYKDNLPTAFAVPDSVTRLYLDKTELDKNHKIAVKKNGSGECYSEYFSLRNCPAFSPEHKVSDGLPPSFNVALNENGLPIITAQSNTTLHVYRIDKSGNERLIASLDKGNISFVDKDITPDAPYSYYIVPVSDGKRGARSEIKSIYVPLKPKNAPPNEDWWEWIYKLIG